MSDVHCQGKKEEKLDAGGPSLTAREKAPMLIHEKGHQLTVRHRGNLEHHLISRLWGKGRSADRSQVLTPETAAEAYFGDVGLYGALQVQR